MERRLAQVHHLFPTNRNLEISAHRKRVIAATDRSSRCLTPAARFSRSKKFIRRRTNTPVGLLKSTNFGANFSHRTGVFSAVKNWVIPSETSARLSSGSKQNCS